MSFSFSLLARIERYFPWHPQPQRTTFTRSTQIILTRIGRLYRERQFSIFLLILIVV